MWKSAWYKIKHLVKGTCYYHCVPETVDGSVSELGNQDATKTQYYRKIHLRK